VSHSIREVLDHVRTIEVFADIRCPFTHVGLRRLVQRRDELGRTDVVVLVRSWPLELVNDEPLDPAMIGEEVAALRAQVAPDLFNGFDPNRFPATSIPGLMLAAAAYEHSLEAGENVSMALRDALFEHGADIADPEVLGRLGAAAGIQPPATAMRAKVLADWHQGQRRGVIGSPHFFAGTEGMFCPSLDISRVDGTLRIASHPVAFDTFLARCLGT
jgi:predicted DsbA family dithiol-disulfide isomerase